jgi:preprotein translocase subunit SecA
VAYKNEGFEMFTELMNNIWEEFARYIFNVEVQVESENGGGGGGQQWPVGGGGRASQTGRLNYAGGTAADQPSALQAAAATVPGGAVPTGIAEAAEYAADATAEPPPRVETRRVADEEKIGRNDPCWCGSGKKFKKCHGA